MEERQQQPALTLPLDDKKSMEELTEARIDSCCNTAETAEKINPISQCQSSDSDAFSGRMLFKGVDMAFITVDEHEMFALNEILEKLLPTTPRTTVCTRLERMNAPRHLCTKQEVRKMKALGGAKPNAVNCTVIARKHVAEYCDKFKDKLQNETNSDTKKSDANTPACLNNLQLYTSMSAAVPVSDETLKSTSVDDNDMMLGTNRLVEDEVGDCLQARKSCKEECKENTETTKETEIQTGKNHERGDNSAKPSVCCGKQSIDLAKLFDSVSRCSAGVISQLPERTPGEAVDKCDEQAPNAFNKRYSHLKRKRKRRTSLEILQSFNSEIGSDKILINKRPRKICNAQGNAEKKVVKKRQHSSVNSNSSQNRPTFHLNSTVANSSSKQSNPQCLQALDLEDVVNDESGEKECYFDQNNNEEDMLPPRSPTLLLKRSVNNEWRIAKTTLARGLNFDDEGRKSSEGYESLLKVENSSESCASSSSNLACSTTGGQQPPVQISSQSTKTLASRPINKRKNSKTTGRCALAKKFVRIKKKKNETTTTKLVDEPENKANEVITHCGLNVPPNPNYKSVTFNNENHYSIGKASINVSKNASTNKSKKKDFETTDNAEKSKQVNKSNDVANKSKPRRRVMNAFRLIETLPYPSFLMIKDGDLCPSYTMTYSSAKGIPGCCHPLWRWRLGKPVPLSLKQPQTNKSSSGESNEQQSGEHCEKERPIVEVKNDEVPSKESTDEQTVGVL